jgi:hypothetical protein
VSAHTGIYESDEKVIHFTNPEAQSTGFSSSSASSSSSFIACWKCREAMRGGHAVRCCLNCFLAGDELRLFAYGVPLWFYNACDIGTLVRSRLTCHTVAEDPPETVLERANKLLNDGGFGTYNVATNNCFDFAFYCKTGVGFFPPAMEIPVTPNLICMIL